jgi:hypothetical protein
MSRVDELLCGHPHADSVKQLVSFFLADLQPCVRSDKLGEPLQELHRHGQRLSP